MAPRCSAVFLLDRCTLLRGTDILFRVQQNLLSTLSFVPVLVPQGCEASLFGCNAVFLLKGLAERTSRDLSVSVVGEDTSPSSTAHCEGTML